MRIISKKKIREYSKLNNQAELPLVEWYYKMINTSATNISDLREVFNSVDYVYGYTIFNIGGNSYRLITAVHYSTQVCYLREIWTHAEYNKAYNKAKLKRGKL